MSFREEPRVIIYTSHGTLISNVMAGKEKIIFPANIIKNVLFFK